MLFTAESAAQSADNRYTCAAGCGKGQSMAGIDIEEWQVRAAREADLDALLALAGKTGGGFTNLPADAGALARRLAKSAQSFARDVHAPGDEMYLLVLEHVPTGAVKGTAALFARVGLEWPFYSYKIATLSLHSRELQRTFRTRVLHLVNDFDGASEVGGLFLDPGCRTGGLGRLLARARYLFIAGHRARFSDRVLAELRGVIRPDGSSPFWDGLAGRFFGMGFVEADRFNSLHGNQFIADLMPKFPVYEALLPDAAAAVIGAVHPDGVPARRMLEAEGFRFNNYVDIFDGGPTLDVETDRIRTVEQARGAEVVGTSTTGLTRLVATGQLHRFRAMAVRLFEGPEGVRLSPGARIAEGERILHAGF
jgi:arginine N-succinyltransferase